MSNKNRKIDIAVSVYKRNIEDPKTGSLTKKEFRAKVIAEIKKELECTNASTLAVYYAWAVRTFHDRPAKQYNFTSPRRGKSSAPKAAPRTTARSRKGKPDGLSEDEKLTKLASEMPKFESKKPILATTSGLVASL